VTGPALVNELLQALPTVGFGRIDVAFRIRGNAVHGIELTRLSPAIPETRHNLKRVAQQNVDFFRWPVCEIDVFCCGSREKAMSQTESVTQRPFLDICSLTKVPVRFENLDAVVHTVADIQQASFRELRAVHRIAELLSDWRVRVVIAKISVVRLMP